VIAAGAAPARDLVLIEIATNLGLRPPVQGREPGVRRMPEAFRRRDFAERIGARRGGRLEAGPYSDDPDRGTGYRNGQALAALAMEQAALLSPIVESGAFPVVVGGDCSILLGDLLALKSLGRYGLIFIDGHDDFSPPRDPAKYEGRLAAAGRDLALAVGEGPSGLADLAGARPYVTEEDVVIFGHYRDPDDERDFDVDLIDARGFRQFPVEELRARGAAVAAEEALCHLETRGLDGFWIHLDVDVLDRSIMPAVDSPNPKGLFFEELVSVLRIFLGHGGARGIELSIYDPDLDPEGVAGDHLVDCLVRGFSPH
jgi:arginase